MKRLHRALARFIRHTLLAGLALTVLAVGGAMAADYFLRRGVAGIGPGEAVILALSELGDVSDTLSPSEGDVLKFSLGAWRAGTDEQEGGGGGGGTGAAVPGFADSIICPDERSSAWQHVYRLCYFDDTVVQYCYPDTGFSVAYLRSGGGVSGYTNNGANNYYLGNCRTTGYFSLPSFQKIHYD